MARAGARSVRVLLVDDHLPNLIALEVTLEPLGAILVRARSGEEALRVLEQQREGFALALVDIRMPGVDGFETTARTREMASARHVPIILLSAEDNARAELHRGYALGVVDVVQKPFDPEVLRAKVKVFIELELRALALRDTELQLREQERALLEQERSHFLRERGAAERRTRLLAEAGALLGSSLDVNVTLQEIASLIVPTLADGCAVDVLNEGQVQRLAAVHVDADKLALAAELERRYPALTDAPFGVPNVLRTGQTEWMADIPDSLLVQTARDAEHLRSTRELGLRSYAIAPLASRGKVLGALTVVQDGSGRRFDAEEVALLEELARRASLAMENALLYRAAVQAEQERAQLLDWERQARLLAQSSEAQLRQLVENLAELAFSERPDGRLEFCNARFYDYTGITHEDLETWSFKRVHHPEHIERVERAWTHSLKTGEPLESEFPVQGKDGLYRWFLARLRPLRASDGAIVRWVGTLADIDDQKRLEAERESLIQALESSNKELDQLAYVASHDLKAPLRGIANLSQWIEEDLGPAVSAEIRVNMELLRGRVRRLEALIDGVLAYSRAGRVKGTRGPVDTRSLLKEVVELLAPKPDARVTFGGPFPIVQAERIPLQQVFLNLVGNAFKHAAREGARVHISAEPDSDGREWTFSVKDNGPGIAAEFQGRIWGIFQTLQARDKVESAGIGLSVVRKIVEGEGGRAWVESGEGQGATFKFTWPCGPRG